MALVRGIVLIAHVLSIVYWLGADAVVFALGFAVRDRNAPLAIRQERLRIMGAVDRRVFQCFLASYLTGLILLALDGFRPLAEPWFRVKIAFAALIVGCAVLLFRVGTMGLLRRALVAQAAGDPVAAELEALAWKNRHYSRGVVLAIYALAIGALTLAVLRPL